MAVIKVEVLETRAAYASAALTTTFQPPAGAREAIFHWSISAVAGTTPIADCKFQFVDPTSGSAIDVDGATFAQQTAASYQALLWSINATADTTGNFRAVKAPLCSVMKAVFAFDRTTTDETYTFTLTAEWLS